MNYGFITLDLLALNLLKQFYKIVFPWPDNAFYGAGVYFKYIICLIVFQQYFNIIYSYKTKKKSGERK
ncbi:hypothetical protein SDC9_61374 [bioreactor metagenome]|uniref:Uncharacterized protein n=1 Tax=bioreactor metagenome TaxID=1076179 RepID=A0A644XFZ0_9ZZZZ